MCPLQSASLIKLKLPPCSWDEKAYKYTIVESLTPPGEVNELDEYVFVVRVRIGEPIDLFADPFTNDDTLDRKTNDPTFYIDIKSEELRDIVRTILRDVKGICLGDDKPTVQLSLPLIEREISNLSLT